MRLTREVWRLAWPAIARNALNCASDRATLILVGHFDDARVHYDGASLGKMFGNITGLSIGLGLNMGLATLCSQAYGAGRAERDNGLHLRRCALVLCITFLFSSAAALFCAPVLRAFAQPDAVAAASARYAQVQLLGVPFFWGASALQTVCDGLQETKPGLYANGGSSVVQLLLSVVAIHPSLLGWGYLGMAAARAVGGVVQFCLMVALIRARRLERLVWRVPADAWGGPKRRVYSWRSLSAYLAVAMPGAVIVCVEWWAFEAFSILVGLLDSPAVALAAHGTMFNILVVTYMTFTGLSTALCACTGKYIGAGRGCVVPALCMRAVSIAVTLSVAICAVLQLLARPLGHLFTNDLAVVDLIDQSMIGPALSVPGYAVLMTLYGACRGADHQRVAALGTFLGYAIGLPLGFALGVKLMWPRPLVGIWLGNVTALAFAAVWVSIIVVRKDWSNVKVVIQWDLANRVSVADSMQPAAPCEPMEQPARTQVSGSVPLLLGVPQEVMSTEPTSLRHSRE